MSEFATIGVNPASMLVDSVATYTLDNLADAAKSGLITVRVNFEDARKVWGETLTEDQFMALSA